MRNLTDTAADGCRRGYRHTGVEAAIGRFRRHSRIYVDMRRGILKDFLTEHKEEVIGVSIFEYDEELARQAAIEDGRILGMEKGREEALLSSIINLKNNLKLTLEQAMDALGIPQSERAEYRRMVHMEDTQ